MEEQWHVAIHSYKRAPVHSVSVPYAAALQPTCGLPGSPLRLTALEKGPEGPECACERFPW